MSAMLVFKIKDAKENEIFHLSKGPLLRNGWPSGYDFWRVFRDLCEASKKYHFAISLKT